jgi:hypothetical protein
VAVKVVVVVGVRVGVAVKVVVVVGLGVGVGSTAHWSQSFVLFSQRDVVPLQEQSSAGGVGFGVDVAVGLGVTAIGLSV